MKNNFIIRYKIFIILMLIFTLLMDISIIFNINYARPFFSIIFLSFIPGLLLVDILRLKIGNTEKIILTVGLSISISLFLGLTTNQLLLSIGYTHPLSTNTLLIIYNLLVPILLVSSYLRNKNKKIQLNLKTEGNSIVYWIIPLFFPVLAIMGTLMMNKFGINIITYLLLLLIPLYLILVSYKRSKLSNEIYPYSLFLIGISLLFMWALRSNYIVFGADTDWEYYLYFMTQSKEFWTNFTNVTYDSCISITILPAIYQKLSGIDPEFIFRMLYPLLFSISPLIVYSIAKKYLGTFYSFLSSFLFISFYQFFTTNNRVDIALIFFGLVIFVMFNDKIRGYHKKILIIIFLISIVLSHYSTSFITLAILIFTTIISFSVNSLKIIRTYFLSYGLINSIKKGMKVFRQKFLEEEDHFGQYSQKMVTLTLVFLFFSIIFVWESSIMKIPFDNFVFFVNMGLINMKNLFLFEYGNSVIRVATGSNYLGIPGTIELVLSWSIIFLTLLGVTALVLQKIVKPHFSNSFENMDQELLIISFIGIVLLVVSFIIPFISTGYNILRTFFQMLFFLNIFFVIGTFTFLNFIKKLKHNWKLSENMKIGFLLLLIIPYFMCTTGTMYEIFHIDRSISLNSHGKEYNDIFIHDEEIVGAKWLSDYKLENESVNTDYLGRFRVIIGGLIPPYPTSVDNNLSRQYSDDYIYLRYFNVVDKRVLAFNSESNITNVPLTSYIYKFKGKIRIYDNGDVHILT